MTVEHTTHTKNNNQNDGRPTAFQMGLGLMIVGASAGMTLYTKKTRQMLGQMERMKQNKELRTKTFFGPPTKEEWERLRPRWDQNDDF